jgi:N-acetylglutamate synthase-like GNAT family acetyltransferase
MAVIEYEIVKNRVGDFSPIFALLRQLWPHKDLKPDQEKRKLFKEKSTRLMIAKEKDKVLGLITFRPKIFGLIGYIPELIVHADVRAKGIGKTLLTKMITYAKKRSCIGIFIASAMRRKHTHRFYKLNNFINIGALFFRVI